MIRKLRNQKIIPTPQIEGWKKKQLKMTRKQLFNSRPLSYPNLTKI